MTAKEKIIPLLGQFAFEVETGIEVGESTLDLAEHLITTDGWTAVRDSAIEILEDPTYRNLWEGSINILFSSIGNGKPIEDENKFIALMYAALKLYPTSHPDRYYDTIWAVVMDLKDVGITTEYEPLDDPDIKPICQSLIQRNTG